jgi:hypothetical protein
MMAMNPPRLVCRHERYQHPSSNISVLLAPLPNVAWPQFFQKTIFSYPSDPSFDKILVEDGRLPFLENTVMGNRAKVYRRLFPFINGRPVVADPSKFDGTIERDPLESRMAYQCCTEAIDPPIDPRARRAVERVLAYPPGTRVVLPWTVYHAPYFGYKLQQLGFELKDTLEVEIINQTQMMVVVVAVSIVTWWIAFVVVRSVFGF